jgi:hypothetical protein
MGECGGVEEDGKGARRGASVVVWRRTGRGGREGHDRRFGEELHADIDRLWRLLVELQDSSGHHGTRVGWVELNSTVKRLGRHVVLLEPHKAHAHAHAHRCRAPGVDLKNLSVLVERIRIPL